MRRRLLLALVLAVAGCTGGGAGRPDVTGPETSPSGPRRGGTLAIALVAPRSLDPAQATRLEGQILAGNLFDGLTALDPAGAARPAAAASWSSDPGLRRWVFRLRPGARWADGTAVRAADFVFAWQRLASPRTRPRPPSPQPLLGTVAGYRAFAAGKARTLSGLQAPDPASLVVQLDRPLADLPAVVANPRLAPLPSTLAAGGLAAWLAQPAGNGPFRPAGRYTPGRPLTLVRNSGHPGPAALLDKVRVDTVPDEQTAWLALQNGQVRFAPVPLDQVAAARAVYGVAADGRTGPGVLQGPTLTTWSLGADLDAEPLDDIRWRQAIALAIDRGRLAAALAGTWVPATDLIPPGVPGAGQTPCPVCGHDPARARTLLGQAGGKRTLTLSVPDTPVDRRIAGLVAADLAAAGVKVAVRPGRAGQLSASDWAADTPRPDAFLASRLGALDAASGYASPAVDRLLAQARSTADEPTRTRLAQQAEEVLLADLPVIPVLVRRHTAVLAPGVEGFNLTAWGAVDLDAVSLPG